MNDKKQNQPSIGAFLGNVAKSVSGTVTDLAGKATDAVAQGKTAVEQAIDVNGDGKIDVEDIIILSLRIPGVRIVREEFLRAEFKKRFPQEVIDDAVLHTPAHAGIAVEEIDKITNSVIAYERNCVSGISTALGMPGGFAMAATISTDIAQYYGFMLRAIQKMLYLYGFPQIDFEEKGQYFDSETLNIMTLCLGAMYGVAGASNTLKTMANALAKGIEKQLLKKALTKGTIYPVVKSVAKWFGVRMTKQMFAGFFKKAIPVVGGLIGGGITFATFKPCCDKLRDSLRDTILSNPNAIVNPEEIDSFIADVEGLEE